MAVKKIAIVLQGISPPSSQEEPPWWVCVLGVLGMIVVIGGAGIIGGELGRHVQNTLMQNQLHEQLEKSGFVEVEPGYWENQK